MAHLKTYRYPKKLILGLVVLFSVLLTSSLLVFSTEFGVGARLEQNVLLSISCLPIVTLAAAPLVWAIYILTIKISISDDGILVEYPFRKSFLKWSDVAEIDRISIFSVLMPSCGKPRDLKITFKNNKTVVVHYFIVSDSGDADGIAALERDILTTLMDA